MKKLSLIFFLIIAASTLFAQNTTQPAVQKIGYVDSQVIMQQFPPAVQAAGALEALTIKYRKQIDSMTTALRTEYADFQKKSTTMKAEQIREANTKFQTKDQAIQLFGQEKQAELKQKNDASMAPIKDSIFKAIEAVAKDEGLSFVFDKLTDAAILLYAEANSDITFKVLDKLKRGK